MYAMNKTDEYKDLTNCTDNKKEDIKNIIKYLFLTKTSSVLLLGFICLTIWTILKPLKTNEG